MGPTQAELQTTWAATDRPRVWSRCAVGRQRALPAQLPWLPSALRPGNALVLQHSADLARDAEHRGRQDAERQALGANWPDLGYVFTTPIGTPIDPRNCTRVVQRQCEVAGVRVVRLHDFRHGCVSVLLGLGVPPRTTMEIVGHTTLEMTMTVYGHVTLDDKRDAMRRLGDLLDESPED